METPMDIARYTFAKMHSRAAKRCENEIIYMIESAIETDRSQRDTVIVRYDRDLTVELLEYLIYQMVEGYTLPKLYDDEVAELAVEVEHELVPFIVQVCEGD